MRNALLDLETLRASRSTPTGASAPSPNADFPVSGAISRRQALGMAGVAAVGASPALRAVETATLGTFTLTQSRHRVTFSLDGRACWVIDSRRFAGAPRLSLTRTPRQIRLTLAGARYPGTPFAADFSCLLQCGVSGWRMHLRMAIGGFATDVPFERWLAGLEPARAAIQLAARPCRFGAQAALLLAGRADAAFSPDWLLTLEGRQIAALRGLGEPLLADRVTIAPGSPEEPSALATPASRRSFIMLRRDAHAWQLPLPRAADAAWQLHAGPDAFATIRLELGEGRPGTAMYALVAESAVGTDAPALTFQPHRALTGRDGLPVALGLRQALFAMALHPSGNQTTLIARYHQPTWLHVGGCAVEIGDAAGAPAFEIHGQDGAITAVQYRPAVLRTVATLPGAVVAPTTVPPGTHLAIVAPGFARAATPQPIEIHVENVPPIAKVFISDPTVSVLRPDDLLWLRFEFMGLTLVAKSGGTPELHVKSTTEGAYLAVYFQGQNIAEQAFFTHDSNYPVPSTHADPDAGKSTDETPFMPAQARLAGESRLVFTAPSGATATPYTLESLLDWQQYDLSVAPTAQPPGGTTSATIGAPSRTQTAIEAPWRLIISPNRFAAWIHAFAPVTHAGRTELWHTRLGVRISPALVGKNAKLAYLEGLYDGQYQYVPVTTADGRRYVVGTEWNQHGADVDVLAAVRTIRAIWTPDYPATARLGENVPFRMSLTGQDRYEIVRLSSDFSRMPKVQHIIINPSTIHLHLAKAASLAAGSQIVARQYPIDLLDAGLRTRQAGAQVPSANVPYTEDTVLPAVSVPSLYTPLPMAVDQLMLSALGAWLNVRGAWGTNPFGLALEEWRHRGTMARDHYVRVVYRGFLFPTRHRASLVKITERRFYRQGGRNIAYLFQRMFIIVREPIKTYGSTNLTDNQGKAYTTTGQNAATGRSIDRWMPFKQVQITTLTTPNLDAPSLIPNVDNQGKYNQSTDVFWPQINGQDFLFHLIVQDGEGQRTELTAPLAFVTYDHFLAFDETAMDALAQAYVNSNTPEYQARRTRPTNGQNVAFAPSNKPGDTTLHAQDVTFGVFVPAASVKLADDEPRFFPIVSAATVRIPALESLLRTGQTPQIRMSDHFLQDGLDGAPNVGEVFAEILDATKPKVTFGSGDSNGTGTPGVVTPNLDINGLSRSLGPVGGDLSQVASGTVGSAATFLQSFFNDSAKILGAIPLSDIIKLPDLSPVFGLLSLIQSVESYPQALSSLASQAMTALQGNLSSLTAEALAPIEGQLTALQSLLSTIKGGLQAVENAINVIPSAVRDLLGDFGTPLTDLTTLLGDLNTLLGDLGTLLADMRAHTLSALSGDATTLQSHLTSFPDDLTKLVQDLGNIPGLNALPKLNNTNLPTAIDTTFKWAPHLQADPLHIFQPGDQFLSVTATIHVPLDGTSPSFNIMGSLGKFDLSLFNVIGVSFGGLTFKAQSGQKPDVTAGDVKVGFQGPLDFVNTLASVIPGSGFNDPPYLDVKPDHIEAGFTLDLPSIGVGIFSLQNISLGAAVTIPFIGADPARLRFNFCTRENPFLLTVSLFGGGGFFAIGVGLDGLDMLEASFEFGGNFSLDLGVASGGVYVMAGIYFKVQKGPPDTAQLTGFLQMGGGLEVLGIISVSVEFYMGLTYEKVGSQSKVYGDATLTVSVSVLFFSTSVSLSVHREFAGSDPTFQDEISQGDWNEYLAAFEV